MKEFIKEVVKEKYYICDVCGAKGSHQQISLCETEHKCQKEGHIKDYYHFRSNEYICGIDSIDIVQKCPCGDEEETVSLNIANQKLIGEVYKLLIKEVGVKRE